MEAETIRKRIYLFLTIGILLIFASFAMLVSAAIFYNFEVFVGGIFTISIAFACWLVAYVLMTKYHGDKE